jgi:hypothetical protein
VFLILALGSNDSDSSTSTSGVSITNEEAANSSDVQQAKNFLEDLPQPACSGSSAYVKSDGTVVINVRCSGNNQSTNGTIEIKDGIVKNVE